MKHVSQLSRRALEDALGQIIDRLFLDANTPDCPPRLRGQEVYDPDKEWSADDLEFIGGLLSTFGLAPGRLGDGPARREDRHSPSRQQQRQLSARPGVGGEIADRVRVTFDLQLDLQLTRRQALRASSAEFRARVRRALEELVLCEE